MIEMKSKLNIFNNSKECVGNPLKYKNKLGLFQVQSNNACVTCLSDDEVSQIKVNSITLVPSGIWIGKVVEVLVNDSDSSLELIVDLKTQISPRPNWEVRSETDRTNLITLLYGTGQFFCNKKSLLKAISSENCDNLNYSGLYKYGMLHCRVYLEAEILCRTPYRNVIVNALGLDQDFLVVGYEEDFQSIDVKLSNNFSRNVVDRVILSNIAYYMLADDTNFDLDFLEILIGSRSVYERAERI